MKRIAILLTACLALALSACQGKPPADQTGNAAGQAQTAVAPAAQTPETTASAAPSGEVVEIREKMFIAQTNEIYLNSRDYLGKTIKYQGFFTSGVFPGNGQLYCYVIRNGPGCCPGVDNTAGFEVKWEKGYPEQNDWVEAMGVLEEYDEGGIKYLRLALTSLAVLPVRGADYVTQ